MGLPWIPMAITTGAGLLGGLLSGEDKVPEPPKMSRSSFWEQWSRKMAKRPEEELAQLSDILSLTRGALSSLYQGQIPDFLSRQAAQQLRTVQEAINWQANLSREAVLEELRKRGILRSSEAPQSLSLLEAERLRNIREAAAQIQTGAAQQALQYGQLAQQMATLPIQTALQLAGLGVERRTAEETARMGAEASLYESRARTERERHGAEMGLVGGIVNAISKLF